MKKSLLIIADLMLISLGNVSYCQDKPRDKGIFEQRDHKADYYQNSILKDIHNVEDKSKPAESKKYFKMDVTGIEVPGTCELYKQQWHNVPVSQGNAGTCWCFSTGSYMESEVFRITGKKVRLSEIYLVYWEYVEKAKGYVESRGTSEFGEGSEANAVTRMMKMYGTAPLTAYSGLMGGRIHHDHEKMKEEMDTYLKSVKKTGAWNETLVIETIKSIMDHYIGTPPTEFIVDGKKYTPKTYLSDYLKIVPDDYVEVLSYMQKPYWKKVEYSVPDNWWHSADYYNFPLDDFMVILKTAVRNGYTVSIGGDVSEVGFDRATRAAVVPTFDIPYEYIDENARQFRFSNKTTTDDHGMHLVGYVEKDGYDWYLIKDSSSGSRNISETSPEFGYYFFREDYVKLKMMDFTVHKDAIKDYVKKFE